MVAPQIAVPSWAILARILSRFLKREFSSQDHGGPSKLANRFVEYCHRGGALPVSRSAPAVRTRAAAAAEMRVRSSPIRAIPLKYIRRR